MAYSLPIITTPVFGIREQVQEGINGLYYTPGQADELKQALELLVRDEERRGCFGRNARHVLGVLNDFDEMADKYATVFREAYFTGQDRRGMAADGGAFSWMSRYSQSIPKEDAERATS